MASKTKNVKVDSLLETLGHSKPETTSILGFDVEIKRNLSIDEVLRVVNNVCHYVVNGDDDTYRPELYDFYFRMYVIEAFTNIEFPSDLDKTYRLLFNTMLYNTIKGRSNEDLIEYLDDTINKKINYLVAVKSRATKLDGLLNAFTDLVLNSGDVVNEQVKEKGQAVIQKISSMGKLDGESLVKAVMGKED